MPSRIASLFVDLNLNTAKFIEELDKSRTKSTIFGVAVGSILADLAKSAVRLGADIAAALPRAFLSAAESADQLAKSSQRIGIATETLSGLKHGAELAGVGFDTLEKGLVRLSGNVLDASFGLKTYTRTFQQLGVEFKNSDGSLRGVEEILGDVADKFSKLEDGTKKAALAQDLFGRAGAQLIPFLNQGRAGLEAAADEAERLGLVISTKTALAAEQFNDNLDRIRKSLSGVALQLASELLPTFAAATNEFVRFIAEGGKIQTIAAGIARSLELAGGAGLFLSEAFLQTINVGQSLYEGLVRLNVATLQLANATTFGAFREELDEALITLDNIERANNDIAKSLLDVQDIRDRLAKGGFEGFAADYERELAKLPKVSRDSGDDAGEALGEGIVIGLVGNLQGVRSTIQSVLEELNRLNAVPTGLATAREITGNIEESLEKLREFEETARESGVEANTLRLQLEQFPPSLADATDQISALGAAFETALPEAASQVSEIDEAFRRLGLVSGFELSGIATQAQSDFDRISESGQASTEQIIEAFVRTQEAIKNAAESGFGTWTNEQEKALRTATSELDKISSTADTVNERFLTLSHSLSTGFEDAILRGNDFRDVLSGILEDIGRIILRSTLTGPNGIIGSLLGSLSGAIGGALGGGGTAFGLPAGFEGPIIPRAEGGPVSSGRPYVVGERGPELFIPGQSGTIVPNATAVPSGGHIAASQSMSVTIHQGDITITGASGDRTELQRLAENIVAAATVRSVQAIEELNRRRA